MGKQKVPSKEAVKTYFDAWREVIKDRRLQGADWPVLFLFRDSGWDEIFLTQKHIGERVGRSRQVANYALNNLEACGYIVGSHPKRGTKKPVTYKLVERLRPPTKFIFFMSESLDMNMSESLDMKKNKIVPVMSKVSDTNVYNGNNINVLAKKLENSKKTTTPNGKGTNKRPASDSANRLLLVVREDLAKDGINFSAKNFSVAVKTIPDGKKTRQQIYTWLANSPLKNGSEKRGGLLYEE